MNTNVQQGQEHMQLPRAIWDRVNWWSVITTVVIGAFTIGVVYSKVGNDIDSLKKDIASASLERKARDDKTDLALYDLKDIPYRVQQTEKALDEIKRQFTLIGDRLGEKVDKVLDNQAKTDTKVEVVSSQVDDIRKTISGKIVWREGPLFNIPILREVSLKPCYLPPRPGYTAIRAYYRVNPYKETPQPVTKTAAR